MISTIEGKFEASDESISVNMENRLNKSFKYLGYSNSFHSHIYFKLPSSKNDYSYPWYYENDGILEPLTSEIEDKVLGIEAKAEYQAESKEVAGAVK